LLANFVIAAANIWLELVFLSIASSVSFFTSSRVYGETLVKLLGLVKIVQAGYGCVKNLPWDVL
jgi:hypothetical protein